MDSDIALSYSVTTLTLLFLIIGLVLNAVALVVFYDVPKLLRSTINTLVRNLFVVHLWTVLVLGPLVSFDCQAHTQQRLGRNNFSAFETYPSTCSLFCTSVRFLREFFTTSVSAILWIMVLDRTMTIVLPKSPSTLYLKRNPTLCTLVACLLAAVGQAHSFFGLFFEEGSRVCEVALHQTLWSYLPESFFLTQVSALVLVSLILLIKLRSAPPKYATGSMKRIVLLVVILIASYIMCTTPQKMSRFLRDSAVQPKILETMSLMSIFAHPLIYYMISVNFRKALRRSIRRRASALTSRHASRSPENVNAALSVTAFSITSETTARQSSSNTHRGVACACEK
ncbi:uncharacterized protein LOC114828187 [Galendromus occidentalis]|uniref:Uncharacterized protein LOC114828187 n=1 Tax=Galendromus occidentalis TaxID=34638 RepID=A0AAJ7SFD4_9ACAR|nr:uncharacterized protein LOC114828187 [Galendromus occidentalis]